MERYSPFQIMAGGLLEKVENNEVSYAELLAGAKEKIQEKEAEAAKNFAGPMSRCARRSPG